MGQGSLDFFSLMLIQLLEIGMHIKVLPGGSLLDWAYCFSDSASPQVTQFTHQQIITPTFGFLDGFHKRPSLGQTIQLSFSHLTQSI